jgi:NAD(P)H dehydrogenase (quinone)
MCLVKSLFRLLVLWALLGGVSWASSARVLIVFDTRTGNTERFAGAVAEGARRVEGVDVILKKTSDVLDEELAGADGILIGSPVHWGNLSSATKAFLDRLGGVLRSKEELGPGSRSRIRAGGAFVTGGSISSGKDLARLGVIASLLDMRFVIVGGEDEEGFGTLGAQATTGGAPPPLDEGELDDGRRFGERFSTITLRLVAR